MIEIFLEPSSQFAPKPVEIVLQGVIGQYLGRIFEQSKRRPIYVVDEVRNDD